jgi:RND family efflux transporter MFP subunit
MSVVDPSFGRSRRYWLAKRWLALLLLLAAAGAFLLLRHKAPASAVAKTTVAVPAPVELSAADVATVETRALSRVLPLSGSLSPLLQTTLKSKVAGEVLELAVREGQTVKKGELLARIDIRNLGARLEAEAATVEKTRADASLAKLNRDNSAALLAEKFISQNAYDTAESTYQASLANLRLAQANQRLALNAVEDANVRAPFDGVIYKRIAQPGEKVSEDSPIVALVNLAEMEMEALAPASEIPAVQPGQSARFRVGGFGERLFEGRVARINPVTEPGSRSIYVYLALANPDSALKGGMFAQGDLVLDKTEPRPAIPLTALRSESGLPYVLVIEDDKLVKRPVTLGLRAENEGYVEVLAGLEPGERVLSARIDTLGPGSVVTLAQAATPAAALSTKVR